MADGLCSGLEAYFFLSLWFNGIFGIQHLGKGGVAAFFEVAFGFLPHRIGQEAIFVVVYLLLCFGNNAQLVPFRYHQVDPDIVIGTEIAQPVLPVIKMLEALCYVQLTIFHTGIAVFTQYLVGYACGPEGGEGQVKSGIVTGETAGFIGLPGHPQPAGQPCPPNPKTRRTQP